MCSDSTKPDDERNSRLPAGQILTFRACLLSGRAARIVRHCKNRVSGTEFELLDTLARNPSDLFHLAGWSPEDWLERLEQDLGMPKLRPDSVGKHALTLLHAEYEELIKRIRDALDPCGFELIVHPDADELRLCVTDREQANAWFATAIEVEESERGGVS